MNKRSINIIKKSVLLTLLASSAAFAAQNDSTVTQADYNRQQQQYNKQHQQKAEKRRAKNKEARQDVTVGDSIATFEYNSDLKAEKKPKKRNKWERVLPFYAQNVIDLGFDLPLPFTLSLIPSHLSQDISLSNLKVGNIAVSGPDGSVLDGVDIANNVTDQVNLVSPEVENNTLQLRAAAWLFPFMQVGAHIGTFKGNTDLFVEVPLSIINTICDNNNVHSLTCRPEYTRKVGADFNPDIKGYNYGLSTNFVTGLNGYFVVLPFSYTWSKTDRTSNTSFLVSPRIGKTFDVHSWGSISPYVGFSYMNNKGTAKDTVKDFKLSDDYTLDSLSYSIDQENSDKYTGLVGANWTITRTYSLAMEGAWGTGRTQYTAILSYHY
ncbi:autotransporter outer membrane beta-barrel domain-containing protein [Vibrio sp. SS-MA-C1-2]|uniref:autotransporter outer membrane beta-barrel domain-containing protein n=1 Tax=Vibrio sp. SS-MA-C1-2 TaxID=2908646 RepID=UPI001F1C2A30|nr:autotransporter outer membrane beta-barrel domain-containing protein [Vibrio sp. SS-MA-C1-2]UJF18136.1 autotransporter outer membrane beta-barrel domain-containing protein [Vibrio sp. SS-MA-C1-2]